MLEVELDIFSGAQNPTWTLSRRQEATLYEILSAEPKQISPAPISNARLGLGYRGMIIRRIKTDDGAWDKAMLERRVPFPNEFRVGIKSAIKDSAADWLVKTANRQGARLDEEIREVVSRGVVIVPRRRGVVDPMATIDLKHFEEADILAREWWDCGDNYFRQNANYFNEPGYVERNNCYCFASNHRANIRNARPGRRGGRPARNYTCGSMIDGLRADGWTDRCRRANLTIAMAIFPGWDYHFYRLTSGRPAWWWGHKPGGTPARYTDECGFYIELQMGGKRPDNCCRGDYVDFCGFFYHDNYSAFVA